jgi:hypothetical protein
MMSSIYGNYQIEPRQRIDYLQMSAGAGFQFQSPQLGYSTPEGMRDKKARVIVLEELPVLETMDRQPEERSQALANQLSRFMEAQGALSCATLLMPSLCSMTRYYGMTEREIRRAFRLLKPEGHDYMIPGMYGNITVWISNRQNAVKNSLSAGGNSILDMIFPIQP